MKTITLRISHLFFVIFLLSEGLYAFSSDSFIISVQTNNDGSSADNEFKIPIYRGVYSYKYDYNYSVDCNYDNTYEATEVTGSYTCSYPTDNNSTARTIAIDGDFPYIYFNNQDDKEKIIAVEQWGTQKWASMNYSFYGASNLVYVGTIAPDLSNVIFTAGMFRGAISFNQDIGDWNVSNVEQMGSMFTGATIFSQDIEDWDVSSVRNMSSMFFHASAFNGDIGDWNVSSVEYMSGMFNGADVFNQDIGDWNVSNVKGMLAMFAGADVFNQDIGNWNVSSVTDMSGMFKGADVFNQDIGDWNVSNVKDMRGMFSGADVFNQNIGNWDVSSVTKMSHMFYNAYSNVFNQDIGSWDVSSVTDMRYMFHNANVFNQDIGNWDISDVNNTSHMFKNATAFYQDIGNWNVSKITDMESMFMGVRLSVSDYDNLLISWNALALQNNVAFDAGDSRYCHGENAKINMQNNNLWTISDNGEYCFFYISSSQTRNVKDAQQEVGEVTVFGNDGSVIEYTIIGGADRDKFNIDLYTGILSFITPPDKENPTDSNADNIYRVRVKAKHPSISDAQTIEVKVGQSDFSPALIMYLLN